MLQQVELKQRIVGGIALVSIAVIVVPFLMDDPRKEVQILESNIPAWPDDLPTTTIELDEQAITPLPQPVVEPLQEPVPQPVAQLSPAPQAKKAPAVVEPAPKSINNTAKPATTQGKQWEVQVVSYGAKSRKRAERFLKRMVDQGYPVELREVTRKGKSTLRIVTQPLTSRKEAKALKKKIDQAFKGDKVQSLVRALK